MFNSQACFFFIPDILFVIDCLCALHSPQQVVCHFCKNLGLLFYPLCCTTKVGSPAFDFKTVNHLNHFNKLWK